MYMARAIARGGDIGYTILPYDLDAPLQQELADHPSDHVLGYIIYDEQTGERKFTYTESGKPIEANEHWSLAIFKEFPLVEQSGQWILYNCAPEKAKLKFGNILSKYAQTLHIDNWDIYAVMGKDATVAVVTSWEIY